METLPITDITIIGALTSVSVVAVTEILKFLSEKKGLKVPPQFILLFLSILVGAGYQAYSMFLPKETQDALWAFVGGSIGFSTTIYAFLIKPVKKALAGKK